MAIINKTGITNGGTIEAEHVTRTIDALSGVSTDTIIATGSFTGSFVGALTGTASFATTASYALNAAGTTTKYYTLTFFHTTVTNTTDTTQKWIGGFAAAPNTASPNQIGLVVPFNGEIIYATATSYASTTDTATIDVDILVNSNPENTITNLDLSVPYDTGYTEPGTAVVASDIVTIRLTENGTSNAVWNINSTVLIKST